MRCRAMIVLALFGLIWIVAGPHAWAMPAADGEAMFAPAAAGPAQATGILLRLRAAAFDPLAGEPDMGTPLRRAADPGRPGLLLVQFAGPIQDAWYQAMRRAGLEVVTYIPDYAYLVWGDAAGVAQLKAQAAVRWAGAYQPGYALHPNLARPEELGAEVEVIVQVYRDPDADRTVQEILARARKVFRPPQAILTYVNLGVRVTPADLTWLVNLPDVVNVEPRPIYRKLDEVQGQIMAGALNAAGTRPSGPGYLAWLLSRGFPTDPNAYPIVDVTDDGIDDGDATPIHADFYVLGSTANPDRLIYNYNWTTDPLADGRAGHGNINASIVAGYNDRAGFPYQDAGGYHYGLGINPFGRVAGSKVFNNVGSWDTNAAPTDLLGNTYALGGRISTNSWGCGSPWCSGGYDAEAQEYDALVRDARPAVAGNQEIVAVFSAGNDGGGGISSPGVAKNVITVGAAENYRPTWTDGCGAGSADADSAQDIADFSSRGPTADGRVKPDLVAPGTHIQGAASQAPGYDGSSVCDQYMPAGQTLYAASSGTSHSTPAVAGAASLVYAWYQTHYGNGRPPTPAMVKAYLINATRYLVGAGAGGNLPSNDQGYGEAHLGMAFDDTRRMVVDQSHLFGATDEVYELQGVVSNPARPFRVTLAWTDAPGPTVGNAYVNDLDLEVEIGGQTYRGNVFSGAVSVPGGLADPRNNVESVFLPAGQSGRFTVRVRAANIAGDGVPGNADSTDQDFALVVYNGVQEAGYIAGTVRDDAGGGALQGVAVQAITGTVAYTATTDAAGYFTMTVVPDTYTVRAWRYGYLLQTVAGVAVVSDTIATVNFTLTQTSPYSLTGQISDLATAAPLSATVSVYGPFGDLIAQANTPQATGLYTFTLYGGPYTVTAQARLHEAGVAAVNLAADTVQHFALAATTTEGILWGYITSLETGNGVAGAAIQVTPGMTQTTSGADGYYEVQLPSGIPYTVTVSAPLYGAASEGGVVVPQSNLLRKDYALPASRLVLAPPEGLSAALRNGEQATRTLTVSNTGSSGLDFAIREAGRDVRPDGGPDPFGYTYQDSRNADGPIYAWIDATDGTPLNLADDGEVNVTLPFTFTFYGTASTAIRVGNNGGLLFNATDGDLWLSNEPLDTATSDDLIVPFWDDVDSYTGNVYYKVIGAAPNRMFVVEWYDRPRFSNIGRATFELILYEGTNNIKFQYRDVVFGDSLYDYGASATVGIRGSGSNYLQYSYNQPVLADGLAICFQYPGSPPCDPVDLPWLSVEPLAGAVAAGDGRPVSVRFDAAAITQTGVYTGFLLFYTNDPEAQPYARYPVTLTALPPLPALSVAKSASAEQVEVGLSLVYTIAVANDGGPATDVSITDTLPANTLFAWADHGGTLVGSDVVWSGLTVPDRSTLRVSYGITVTCVPSGTLIVNDGYRVTATEWPTATTGLPVTATATAEGVRADFAYGPLPALVNRPVAFENRSRHAAGYAWDFGDGGASTLAGPDHAYTAVGAYTVVLTATNLCSADVISRPITVEDYALRLTPATAAQSGNAGQIVTYTLYLTNTGTLPDTFRLSRGNTPWATTLATDTVRLEAGEAAGVEVYVAVPPNAAGGAQASVRVTAQSQNDPRTPPAAASAVLTTTANTVYGLDFSAPLSEQTTQPGQVVTYTLRVTNTGNAVDTIVLTRTNAGWPTAFSWTELAIAAAGWRTAEVYITAPADARWGTADTAIIQAAGAGGARTVTLITSLPPRRIYLPLVLRNQP